MIIKISTKSRNDFTVVYSDSCKIVDKIKNKFSIGESGDIHEFNKNLCDMSLVSVIEDHFPGFKSSTINNTDHNIISKMFSNKTMFELTEYNLFTYLGNSRIDGNPVFLVDYSSHRNYLLEQLGI